ncbi:hypothetical protein ASPWEDRAFT_115016 [Aspergillus wentii DTO 134E9]|uniref:Amino acid transporter transmembrane domain-containing protein n=1 Tax=Aspergillus wentii DTO 134E9 TaxID=1073089 RepID=A0A1L9RCZ0_ASPWE|nr:uncharacterized protein ASPWEDRAFT_115016 [Aspergillus wentii DTO 134E9]OJJ32733.1 hypothetical protein ASPWEDRAFT_115016 [Aspergillus wentii DTO 134E9]
MGLSEVGANENQWNYDVKDLKEEVPEAFDPFGSEETAEVQYKTLEWWQCGTLMVAETVSVGVLSIPATLATIGLVPGIILIIVLGLITTYTGYVIGQFRQRYPSVHSMADAAGVVFGPLGREIFGVAQFVFFIFAAGSHLLTWTVMMNTLTDHGTCTVVFGVIGMVVSLVCALPRTMKNISWLAATSFLSIFTAVFITMIGVGVERPGDGKIDIFRQTSFVNGFTAVTNIVFAYCGHAAFFGVIAEMKNPRDFPKAVAMLQGFEIVFYTVASIVIYRYAGQGVASPALGSTGPVLRKVAYGIAIPTIVIGGVVNGHIAVKNVYVRIFRGSDTMHKRSFKATSTWFGLNLTFWIIAWVIAEAIPVFNNLLSLVSALFASWFSFGFGGIFWLYLNKGNYFSSTRKTCLTIVNVGVLGVGITICALGLWVSGLAIHKDGSKASFSCANNAI